MKKLNFLAILLFIVCPAGVLNAQTLITDPGNGHYCQGQVPIGVQIKIQNSVNGTTYILKKVGAPPPNNWGQIEGNGATVTFPGTFQAGTYFTLPATTQATVVMDPQPSPFNVTITSGGYFCNYPGSQGVAIGISGSTIGVEYTLYDPTNNPILPAWTGDGLAHSFGFFNTPGAYHVIAEIPATGCTRNFGSVTVVSYAPPTAGFTSAPPNQCANTPVQFTDASLLGEPDAEIISWEWNFDDLNSGTKNTSAIQNPVHTFEAWGNGSQTFQVNLKVTDENGCFVEVTHPVSVQQKPDAALTATGNGIQTKTIDGEIYFTHCGTENNVVFTFQNNSTTSTTNTLYEIDWENDGTNDYSDASFSSSVDNTYSLGSHILKFTVHGPVGSNCPHVKLYNIFVGANPAGGISNPGNTWILSGENIDFQWQPQVFTNSPGTNYYIDFGDGETAEYTQSTIPLGGISHTYTACSYEQLWCGPESLYNFMASCNAVNPCGFSPTFVCPIIVSCPSQPSFGGGNGSFGGGSYWGAQPGEIIACNPVSFSDSTQSGFYINQNGNVVIEDTYYLWDFGDPASGINNTSTLPEPTHTFSNSCEVYTVTLITYTGEYGGPNSGVDTISHQVLIQEEPVAVFTMDDSGDDCVPKQVQIINTSDIGCFGVPLYKWTVDPPAGWQIITPGFEGDDTYPEPLFQFNTSGTFDIKMIIENSCGTDTLIESVLVCQPPEVSFDDEYWYCGVGDRNFALENIPVFVLNCDPPITYLWEVNGPAPVTFVAPTTNTSDFPIINFPVEGTYEVTVTITNECGTEEATQTIYITNSIDNNIIHDDMEVCTDESPISITGDLPTGGTGIYTYKWEKAIAGNPFAPIVPSATGQNYIIVNPLTETTWYRRWAYDDGNCSDLSNEIEITVFPAIDNNNILINQTICEGSAPEILTGTIPFGGNEPVTYQWYYSEDGVDWNLIPGAENLDYQHGNLFVTTYFRREAIAAPCNSNFSTPVTITVCSPLANNIIYEDQTICQDTPPEMLTGTEPAGACGDFSYQWQYDTDVLPDFVDIPPATQQNYQPLAISVKTYYRRIVKSDICDNDTSNVVTMDIMPKPDVNAGINQIIVNGASANLVGSVSGGNPPYSTYQWEPTSKIAGPSNQLSVTTVPLNTTTTFTLCVTDAEGCEDCDEMIVSVEGDPLAVTVNPPSAEVCPGAQVQLCANPSGGTGNYTYSWISSPPGTNSAQPCIDVFPNLTTSYTLTVFDGWSTVEAVAIVTVLPVPLITSTLNLAVCSGEPLDYEPQSTVAGSTYTWVTIPGGSCSGNASGNGTIIGDAILNAGNDECIVTYDIIPTSPNGCSGSSVTLVVHVQPVPLITNAISQQTVVSGQQTIPVTFTSNVADVDYHWEYFSDNLCPGLIAYSQLIGETSVLPAQTISILPGGPPACVLTYEVTAYLTLPGGEECWGTPFHYNIIINLEPTQYELICPVPICSGQAATISLSASEPGVDYMLIRNGNIPVLPFLPGTGFQLDWPNLNIAGAYSIRATNLSNGQISMMNGMCQLTVNPLPAIYVLTAQNGDHCTPVTPLLSGSQINVEYQLILDGTSIVQVVPGNGLATFLAFAPVDLPGTYTIHAYNPLTGCEREMQGSITVDPSPMEFPIFPGGVICEGTQICIDGWEVGVEYQLWKDDDAFSGFFTGLPGEPFLCFDPLTDGPGVYRVYARYPATGCDIFFTEEQVVYENPLNFNISPEVGCPGTEIILEGCQEGITYELWFDPPTPAKKQDPEIAGPLITIICDPLHPILSFGEWWDEGTYTVKAISPENCVSWMDDQTVVKAAPTVFNMSPEGWSCPPVEILLDNSEEGVEYRLLKDGIWDPVNFVIGPAGGGQISFGIHSESGVYSINAFFSHENGLECWSEMNGSYEIKENPIAFILSPQPGIYCPCREVTLSGSEPGVAYFLKNTLTGTIYPDPANPDAGIPGTGASLTFGNICEPGEYYSYGKNELDPENCDADMDGSFTISASPDNSFQLLSVPSSKYCFGENGVALKLTGSQNLIVQYQLYKVAGGGGTPIGGAPKIGTGGELIWLNVLAGEYFVVATFIGDPTCPVEMENHVIIEEIPLPAASIVEHEGLCIGECFDLTFNLTGIGPWDLTFTAQDAINGSVINTIPNIATTPYIIFNTCLANTTTYSINSIKNSDDPWCEGTDLGSPVVIEIIQLPEVNAGDDGVICYNETYTVPNVSMNNVSDFVWTITTGNGSLDNPNIVNPTYTPASGDEGTTVELTLDVTGDLACVSETTSDNVFIQVDQLPLADAGDDGIVCFNGSYTVQNVSMTNVSDFVWTITVGNGSLDSPTIINPTYTPAIGDEGTNVELTLDVTGDLACLTETTSDNVFIYIDELPLVDAGDDGVICYNGTYTVPNVSMNNVSDFVWTITAGSGSLDNPNIINPTYTPAIGDEGTTVELTLEATGDLACIAETNSDIVFIQIDPLPLVDAGDDAVICFSGNYTVPNVSMNNVSGFAWTITSGNGSLDNPNIINPTYTPATGDDGTTVQLTLDGYGVLACSGENATDVVFIQVDPLPEVNAGDDGLICYSQTYTVPNVSMTDVSGFTWTITAGNGVLDNPNIISPTYTPASGDEGTTIVLTLEAIGDFACSAETVTDEVYIQVDPLPEVNAGDDGLICYSETYTVPNVSMNNVSDFVWTITTGNGSIDNQNIVNPTYTPASGDEGTIVTLTLEVTGSLECSGQTATDVVSIQVDQLPDISSLPAIMICSGEPVNYTPEAANTPGATFAWTLANNTAGCITVSGVPAPDIISDILVNNCNLVKTVTYNIIPTGATPLFCEGESFALTVSVNPVAHITNIVEEQFINSGEVSQEVTFASDIVGTNVTYEWVGQESIPELEGWIDQGVNGFLPQMPVSIIGADPPDQGEVIYTITPFVNGCPGVTFEYTIHVYLLPYVYELMGGGEFCDDGQTNAEIRLMSSQPKINYQLIPNGQIKPGTGNELLWAVNQTGTYTVLAINPNTGVEMLMNGSVQVTARDLPLIFDLDMVAQEDNCLPVTPRLNGSQTGTSYQLLLDGEPSGNPVDGTSAPILFPEQVEAGIYSVIANIDYDQISCSNVMTGEIVADAVPQQIDIIPNGDICENEDPICILNSEPGIEYQLWTNNQLVGSVIIGDGEAICFDLIDNPGTYRIHAVNAVTGCDALFDQEVTVHPYPLLFQMTPEFGCPGTQVILNNCQNGIEYYLYLQMPSSDGGTSEKMEVVGPILCDGDAEIDFGQQWDEGEYSVLAINPEFNCESWMESTTTIFSSPIAFLVEAEGDACPPRTVLLEDCQAEVDYELYFDDLSGNPANPVFLASRNCASGEIRFEGLTVPGVYSITGIWNHNSVVCETPMAGSVTILPKPEVFTLSPDQASCPPVIFTLNGSQDGVTYELYFQNGTKKDEIIGDGLSIVTFAEMNQAGTYYVKAIAPNTCDTIMDSIGIILEKPASYAVTPNPNGNYCVDDNIQIGLNGSDLDISYQLRRIGAANNPQATSAGTGGQVIFVTPEPLLAGVYRVMAVDDESDCWSWMPGDIRIHDNPDEYTITADGVEVNNMADHCPPVEIGLSWSEINVVYSLYCDENPGGAVASLQGTGSEILFGDFTNPGAYHIEAKNVLTSCEKIMNGIINVSDGPTVYQVICETPLFCEGRNDQVDITLTNSQPNVSYELLFNGNSLDPVQTKIGDGGLLIWQGVSQFGQGTFSLRGTFPNDPMCTSMMTPQIIVQELPLPAAHINGDTIVCLGDSATIPLTLTGEVLDWKVTYWINQTPQPEIIIPVGGAYEIVVRNITEVAVIELHNVSYNEAPFCEGIVSGLYLINVDPLPVIIAGDDGSVCLGDSFTVANPDTLNVATFTWALDPPEFGELNDENTLTPTFIPNQNAGNNFVQLILSAGGYGACSYHSVTSSLSVWVDSLPAVNAGTDTIICATELLQLNGFAQNYNSPFWYDLSGLGTFSDQHELNPSYQITSPGDIAEPTIIQLVLSVNGVGECGYHSVSSTILVEVIPEPQNISAGVDDTLCENQEYFTLYSATADQVSAINWTTTGDGSFEDAALLNANYFPGITDIQTGSVELCLEALPLSPCTVSVNDCITLIIQGLPFANAGEDAQICENILSFPLMGDAENYSATSWTTSGDGYFDNFQSLQASYFPGSADIESGVVELCLSAFSKVPCLLEDSVHSCFTLSIQKLPVALAGPDSIICENMSYYFDEQFVSAAYMDSLQWFGGDGVFDDINMLNATYTPGVNDIANGFVSICLSAYPSNPCLIVDSVRSCMVLGIERIPVIDIGADATLCENTSYTFNNVIATGYESLQWYGGDGVFDDAHILNTSYTPGDTDIANGFVDLCLTAFANSPCQLIDSVQNCVQLIIQQLPMVNAGDDVLICESQGDLELSMASAGLYSGLEWSTYPVGSGSFDDATILNPVFSFPQISEPSTICLILTAAGIAPCDISEIKDTVFLKIDPSPELFAGNPLSVCVSSHIQIKDADTSYISGFMWSIKSGYGELDDPTRIDPTFYPDNADAGTTVELELKAAGYGSCIADEIVSTVLIDVAGLPEILITDPTGTLCVNDNDGFTIASGVVGISNYSSFSWEIDYSTGAGQLQNALSLTPTYIPHPIDAGKSVLLKLIAYGLVACEDNTSEQFFEIKVGANPFVDFAAVNNNADSALCPDQRAYFEDLTSFWPFQIHDDQIITNRIWKFGDGDEYDAGNETVVEHTFPNPGIYDITLIIKTNINGIESCIDSLSKEIKINESPVAGFFIEKLYNCNGWVQFTDTSKSAQSYISDWWWTFGDDYYSDLQNPQFEFETSGTKDVTLTTYDNNGCMNTITKSIYIDDFFDYEIKFQSDCFGQPVAFEVDTLSILPAGNQIDIYEWTFGDGSDSDASIFPEHTYREPGSYQVVLAATDNSGCLLLKNAIVVIPGPLNPEFTFDECNNPLTFIGATSYNIDAYEKWEWDFGDGIVETIIKPNDPVISHTYNHMGAYTVKLIVTDTIGCTDTISVQNVRTECLDYKGFYIPNAFAPEHPNEEVKLFKPKGVGLEEYYVKVYDTWGNLLWESTLLDDQGSPLESWDGNYKGANMPPGTYVYTAYAKFKDGTIWGGDGDVPASNAENISGTILLIR